MSMSKFYREMYIEAALWLAVLIACMAKIAQHL